MFDLFNSFFLLRQGSMFECECSIAVRSAPKFNYFRMSQQDFWRETLFINEIDYLGYKSIFVRRFRRECFNELFPFRFGMLRCVASL